MALVGWTAVAACMTMTTAWAQAPADAPAPVSTSDAPVVAAPAPSPLSADAPPLAPADAVPSAPPTTVVAAPAPIQASVLQAPDLFSAANGVTGLPSDLWRGSSADLARTVMPLIAQKPLSPAAAAFALRLASTGGQAPDGAGADPDLAAARIAIVLALGDAAGAHAMLEHTGGVSASPALSQVAAEADLVLGMEDQACLVGDSLTQGKDGPYWRRLRAYCLLRAGNTDGAQLAYDLAESQAKDVTYKRLMSAAVSGTPAGEADLRNGLDFALSQRLKLDVTPAIDKAWAPVAAVLAANTAQPDAIRAAAAARLRGGRPGAPSPIAAPVLTPLLAGDLQAAGSARAQIERNDAAGATVLELALIDAALTTAQGRIDPAVMDELVERGAAGEAKDRASAQAAAALYAALGAAMSGQARAEFASFDLGRAPGAQARLFELTLGANGLAPGDIALISLWIAADGGAAGPGPATRAQIVHALNQAGFTRDARALALEGLVDLMSPAPEPTPRPRAPAPPRRPRR